MRGTNRRIVKRKRMRLKSPRMTRRKTRSRIKRTIRKTTRKTTKRLTIKKKMIKKILTLRKMTTTFRVVLIFI